MRAMNFPAGSVEETARTEGMILVVRYSTLDRYAREMHTDGESVEKAAMKKDETLEMISGRDEANFCAESMTKGGRGGRSGLTGGGGGGVAALKSVKVSYIQKTW